MRRAVKLQKQQLFQVGQNCDYSHNNFKVHLSSVSSYSPRTFSLWCPEQGYLLTCIFSVGVTDDNHETLKQTTQQLYIR